ncbi:hypothetical protein Tco_1254477 [Tanacetum coccineum]
MVAFLEKCAKSYAFHEIIDFLNANQIRYALTVNPTIYTSCIEQFWATTKKKQSRRKQAKNTKVPHTSDSTADVPNEEHVPTHSNDPLLSGEDRMKLTELMDMCTKFFKRVLDLEHNKTAEAQEIINLKLRVKKLEKKAGLRTHKFKRLYKVGVTRRVASSDDEGLGAQEDASNRGGVELKPLTRYLSYLVETQEEECCE